MKTSVKSPVDKYLNGAFLKGMLVACFISFSVVAFAEVAVRLIA